MKKITIELIITAISIVVIDLSSKYLGFEITVTAVLGLMMSKVFVIESRK